MEDTALELLKIGFLAIFAFIVVRAAFKLKK